MTKGTPIQKSGFILDEMCYDLLGKIQNRPGISVRGLFLSFGGIVSESCVRSRVVMLSAHGYVLMEKSGRNIALMLSGNGYAAIQENVMSRKRVWPEMGDTFEHDSWIEDVDIICPGCCESDGTRCGWYMMLECATTRHLATKKNNNTAFPTGENK